MSGQALIPQPIEELDNCHMKFVLFNECADVDLFGLQKVMTGNLSIDSLASVDLGLMRLSHEFTLSQYSQVIVNIKHWRDIAIQREQFKQIDELEYLVNYLKDISEQVMDILNSADFQEILTNQAKSA